MKKNIFIIIIIFALTGCNAVEYSVMEEERFINEDVMSNGFEDYPKWDKNLKSQISELQMLWEKFDSEKDETVDPTEDFHNSKYLEKFKNFLGQRKSIEVSPDDLGRILKQNDLAYIEKEIFVGKDKFNMRIIGYNVDFYVKAITDYVDIKNKWIFIQCWTENEFYFATLSDGDIHAFYDFIPLEIDNTLHVILIGQSCPSYPYVPFLWAWDLKEGEFHPTNLFNFSSMKKDKYLIDNNVNLYNREGKGKTTLHTDGSYLFVEYGALAGENELSPSAYLNICCDIDEENKIFSFSIVEEEVAIIRIKLKYDLFVIE